MGNILSFLAPPPYVSLPASKVEDTILIYYTDLASSTLKASVSKVSDESYGNASNLLKNSSPSSRRENLDGTKDAWQTKRHSESEWVVVELGCSGRIIGFDIDTSTYTDSAPVTATVEGFNIHLEGKGDWETLLPNVPIKPSSHNFYVLEDTPKIFSRIRLTTSPGGSVARLRCYGTVVPVWPGKISQPVNLALATNGARIVRWTDTTSGNKPNILLSGGTSMEDGWETPRSRLDDRNDMVIIQLGSPGYVSHISIDTSYFIGNAPQFVQVDGCFSLEDDPNMDYDVNWIELVSKSRIEANGVKNFKVSAANKALSHIRLTVYPDGGIQQISVFGTLRKTDHEQNHRIAKDLARKESHSSIDSSSSSNYNNSPKPIASSLSKPDKPIVAVKSTQMKKKHVRIQDVVVEKKPSSAKRGRSAKRKAEDAIKALPKKPRSVSKKRGKKASSQ